MEECFEGYIDHRVDLFEDGEVAHPCVFPGDQDLMVTNHPGGNFPGVSS